MADPDRADSRPPGDILRPMEQEEAALRRRTRRSFLGFGAAATLGYAGWRWLRGRRTDDGAAWPIRTALEGNEGLARDLFSSSHRTPQHPFGSAPDNPRLNGDLGLDGVIDPSAWRLHVGGLSQGSGIASLTLDDIKALPLVRTTMRLCCIEGWDIWVNWGGARFRDFLLRYPPITKSGQPVDLEHRSDDLYDYVSLATPDGGYYVGLDLASAVHPQTLLCYEIDGQPLTAQHGAPLRLVIPTKYGIKSIKRIGAIRYTGVRPADYWAQQGYDWFAGL